MILKELIDIFLEYKKKRVKDSTFYLYNFLKKYLLDYFDEKIEIKTLNTMQIQFLFFLYKYQKDIPAKKELEQHLNRYKRSLNINDI